MITLKSKLEFIVDKLLMHAMLGSGNRKKIGDLIKYLSKEEKELLKHIKSEHFNQRLK